MMLRGAGFVVHDLGVDTAPDEFVDAVMEREAELLGMSALLTTTMPNMGQDDRHVRGVRAARRCEDNGGRRAPLTQEFADDFGADGYGKDAMGVRRPRQALPRHRGDGGRHGCGGRLMRPKPESRANPSPRARAEASA